MPLYDYRCNSCLKIVERLAPMLGEVAVNHAICGGKLVRVFTPATAGVVYKGAGWAKTDRRKGRRP
jgi:putative FmdB family regulatory protein